MNKIICILLVLCCFIIAPLACYAAPDTQSDLERLQGRWVRPDGGYVIEISGVQAEGTLDAAYFNPAVINVSRAAWRDENGILIIFIELNDTNYPGATYNLRYDQENDQLAGEYFQPLLQQTFDIFFIREKVINKKNVASS
jgi:hypothetical protein